MEYVVKQIISGIEFWKISSSKTSCDQSVDGKVFISINRFCRSAHNLPAAFWKEDCKSLKLGMHVSGTWMESSKWASEALRGGRGSTSPALVGIHAQFLKTQLSWGVFPRFLLILKRQTFFFFPPSSRSADRNSKRKLNCPASWTNISGHSRRWCIEWGVSVS